LRIKISRAINLLTLFLFFPVSAFALDEINQKGVEAITYEHVSNWAISLFVVLCLFFVCVWLMKKMGALSPINSRDKMKVVAGLSLGGREKIVLVQVGEKQLLLGVSPGKIDNLLVLEGDDCIYQEKNNGMSEAENDFSHKLKQIMKGSLNE
jgi:flagellar protein FliO/FliZ